MKRDRSAAGRPAFDLIEEAFHAWRTCPLVAFCWYYLGALPFVLALLYFWMDMSRGAFAAGHRTESALGLAVLFVWMKTCQAVFALRVRESLRAREGAAVGVRRLARIAIFQAVLQPSKFFVLPVAALIAVPLAWTVAFYHTVSALGDEESLSTFWKKATRQALLWPKQNHLALALLSLFGIFVFANVVATLAFAPHLFRMLTGVETVFTRTPVAMLNTTFVAVAVALTYLCYDPLLKVVYVLRCFHGEAVHSGEDLRVGLRQLTARMALVAFCFGALVAGPVSASAPPAVPPPQLDAAIEQTIARPEFSWRMPRESDGRSLQERVPLLAKFGAWLKRTGDRIGEWLSDLMEWLLRRSPQASPGSGAGLSEMSRKLLIGCLVLAAVAVVLLVARVVLQRRRTPRLTATPLAAAPVDVADESVTADQLAEEEWLELARSLIAQSELRLALRALFLAGLAALARREIITLAKFKSNRDYERELRRRAADRPPLQEAFATNVSLVERAWYGEHAVTEETLQLFRSNLEEIRT